MSPEKRPQYLECSLIFDGGSSNNPGFGYGSYLLTTPAGRGQPRRVEFGRGVTNNQAEYLALIAGLRDLIATLEGSGGQPGACSLEVRGDSSLVINQLLGRWKVRHSGLQPLHAQARELLSRFGQVRLVWVPRAVSVRVLGH